MHPQDWLPLWIGVAAGIVLGAAVIAYAFGRPMSGPKRLGAVGLSLIALVICPAIGFWFILVRVIGDPTPPVP